MKVNINLFIILLAISTFAYAKDNFVFINGGTFVMGSDSKEFAESDEYYPHNVTLGSFYLDKYETTIKNVADVYNYALQKKYIYVKGNIAYLDSNDKILLKTDGGINIKCIQFEKGKFFYDEEAADYPIMQIS